MYFVDLVTLHDSAISITTMKQTHLISGLHSRLQVFRNNQGLFQKLKGVLCPRLKYRFVE